MRFLSYILLAIITTLQCSCAQTPSRRIKGRIVDESKQHCEISIWSQRKDGACTIHNKIGECNKDGYFDIKLPPDNIEAICFYTTQEPNNMHSWIHLHMIPLPLSSKENIIELENIKVNVMMTTKKLISDIKESMKNSDNVIKRKSYSRPTTDTDDVITITSDINRAGNVVEVFPTPASEVEEDRKLRTTMRSLHDSTGKRYDTLRDTFFFPKKVDMKGNNRKKEILARNPYEHDWLAQSIILRIDNPADYEGFSYLLAGKIKSLRKDNTRPEFFGVYLWGFLSHYFNGRQVVLWSLENILKKNDMSKSEKTQIISIILNLYWPSKFFTQLAKNAGLSEELMFSAMTSLLKSNICNETCKAYCDKLTEKQKRKMKMLDTIKDFLERTP